MELSGDEVILERDEQKAFGLTERCLATTALESVWEQVCEAADERLEKLRRTDAPSSQIVFGPWGMVVGILHSTRPQLARLERRQRLLRELEPTVRAIAWETVP